MSERKSKQRNRTKRIQKISTCWVRDKHTHRLLFVPGLKAQSVQPEGSSEVPGKSKK